MFKHTHTLTHTQTHTHTHTQIHIHPQTPTHTNTLTHPHTNIYTHTYIHTYTHIHKQTLVDYWQARLTLTRYQMTLTLTWHIDKIILNMYTKFEFNLTIGSWSTARTKFSLNREFDLDLWPYDLDLITNCSPHQCLPPHQVWFHSDQ